MRLLRKLKEWATDGPSKPVINLVDLFLTLSATEHIKRYGYPYSIQWESQPVREDN